MKFMEIYQIEQNDPSPLACGRTMQSELIAAKLRISHASSTLSRTASSDTKIKKGKCFLPFFPNCAFSVIIITAVRLHNCIKEKITFLHFHFFQPFYIFCLSAIFRK
ncbi:hypothetical protein ACJX0J_021605 [Zea mays]